MEIQFLWREVMIIPDHLIRGFSDSYRPMIIFRNEDGSFRSGFVLRVDEFVISLRQQAEARRMAGLPAESE